MSSEDVIKELFSFRFLNLSGYHAVRELMRGGMGSLDGRAGASPWSDLPVSTVETYTIHTLQYRKAAALGRGRPTLLFKPVEEAAWRK